MNVKSYSDKKLIKSIELIAFLTYRGFSWIGEPLGDGRFKWAAFEDTQELRAAIDEFYRDSNERRLFDHHRRAKQFLLD